MTLVEMAMVVGGLALVGVAVAVTLLWQKVGRVETRVSALEAEVGVPWADRRLEQSVILRVMTLEILHALRAKKR